MSMELKYELRDAAVGRGGMEGKGLEVDGEVERAAESGREKERRRIVTTRLMSCGEGAADETSRRK
jgi:hypothetical protein